MRRLVPPLAVLACLLAFASTAIAGGRLYYPHYNTDELGVFDRGADGTIAPVAGSPFKAVGSPSPVTGLVGFGFTPDGSRAAASFLFGGGVQGLSIAASGGVNPVNALSTRQSEGLAVSPDGHFAYEATREYPPGSVADGINVFSIGADGALTLAGAPVDPAVSFGEVAVTPDGRFLYATTETELRRYAIGADGSLSALAPLVATGLRLPTVSPDGRFLFVTIGGGPSLASYAIGPDGSLAGRGEPLSLSGSPRAFGVAPDGSRLFVPEPSSERIRTIAVAADGSLQAGSSIAVDEPRAATVSPGGDFLYWYADGSPHGIGMASIGPDGGLVPLPSVFPWDTTVPGQFFFQPQPAPVASFVSRPGAPGAATRFNATASERAARFDWDFGDGTTLADGGPNPTHVYAAAGVYQARLSVTDASGCSAKQIYTGQSTTCPGGAATSVAAAVDTLPALSRLKATPKKFAAAGRGKGRKATSSKRVGTRFRYRLTERATVRFKIERRLPGRWTGRKCVRKTAKNAKRKPCSRYRRLGSRTAKGRAGANRSYFAGRLRGRKLAPGPYRVTAVATDPAGGRSTPRRTAFRIR